MAAPRKGARVALANLGVIVSPAITSPHAFAYEACDIPPGMTIREYRAQRARTRRPRRFARFGRVLRRRHTLRFA